MQLMYLWYCDVDKDFYDDDKLIAWIVSAGQITYLIKAYKKLQEGINNDNRAE